MGSKIVPDSLPCRHGILFLMEFIPTKEKMPEIEIVPVSPDDAEGVNEVMYKTWLATYPNEEAGITTEDIEERFRDRLLPERIQVSRDRLTDIPQNEKRLVAKIAGKVVGVLRVIREVDKNTLQTLYVLPEYHGKGIGTDLWKAGKAFLDSEKDTYLEVAEYNEHAITFYRQLGFEDTGKRFADERFRMKSGSIVPEIEMRLAGEGSLSEKF